MPHLSPRKWNSLQIWVMAILIKVKNWSSCPVVEGVEKVMADIQSWAQVEVQPDILNSFVSVCAALRGQNVDLSSPPANTLTCTGLVCMLEGALGREEKTWVLVLALPFLAVGSWAGYFASLSFSYQELDQVITFTSPSGMLCTSSGTMLFTDRVCGSPVLT